MIIGLAVAQKLFAMPVYQQAKNVSVYISKTGPEVSTSAIIHDLLNRNVNCFVPRCVSDTVMEMVKIRSFADLNSLPLNKMGIAEPLLNEARENALDSESLDVIIMPGLAFDRTKARIGYGRGYYDRFIEQCQQHFSQDKQPATVAIALDEQLVDEVPTDEHDRRPDMFAGRALVWGRRYSSTWRTSNNAVEDLASSPITPVTLSYLLELGKTRNALESARFLHHELPKRLARRVRALQKLPFIVGVNPYIKKVYQLYYDSFEILRSIPQPIDEVSQAEFSDTLGDLVSSHQDVIPQLAKGFQECGKYMTKESAASFLDGMIHARIGIRVLAEHHIALQEDVPGWIGIVNTRLSPVALLKSTSEYVQELCEMHYGTSPEFVFNGHVDTSIAYISVHLEYIFMELLKNASRATVEWSHRTSRSAHPVIEVTIGQGKEDISIRIRDQGGGIPTHEMLRVFDYSYTTVPKTDLDDDNNIFASQSRISMQASVGGPIAGLGFGLPMSRIYAKYFGGALELKSIAGHGLDVFLRVPSITLTNTSEMRI
ncbi:hypothetical protein HDU67_009959 [Dinochytrium kinnereticum]|nr:hypothetical protein HDU67_009959 [Dinochytrium kinnereticum]